MNTHTFINALGKLSAIPAEKKKEFLALAPNLPPAQQELILAQLQTLNVQLQKTDTKYASSVQRGREALNQVKQNDLPAFDAILHDA